MKPTSVQDDDQTRRSSVSSLAHAHGTCWLVYIPCTCGVHCLPCGVMQSCLMPGCSSKTIFISVHPPRYASVLFTTTASGTRLTAHERSLTPHCGPCTSVRAPGTCTRYVHQIMAEPTAWGGGDLNRALPEKSPVSSLDMASAGGEIRAQSDAHAHADWAPVRTQEQGRQLAALLPQQALRADGRGCPRYAPFNAPPCPPVTPPIMSCHSGW